MISKKEKNPSVIGIPVFFLLINLYSHGPDQPQIPLKAVEKKYPDKFFYAGWMGPERYSLLAACDYTLLPSRWEKWKRARLCPPVMELLVYLLNAIYNSYP